MRNAVLEQLCPRFSREHGRPFTIKVNEVLRVLSTLELVLEVGQLGLTSENKHAEEWDIRWRVWMEQTNHGGLG